MEQTTSVRFEKKLRGRLNRMAAKTNTPASDIIRLAVAQFLDAHTHAADVIAAVVKARTEQN